MGGLANISMYACKNVVSGCDSWVIWLKYVVFRRWVSVGKKLKEGGLNPYCITIMDIASVWRLVAVREGN